MPARIYIYTYVHILYAYATVGMLRRKYFFLVTWRGIAGIQMLGESWDSSGLKELKKQQKGVGNLPFRPRDLLYVSENLQESPRIDTHAVWRFRTFFLFHWEFHHPK